MALPRHKGICFMLVLKWGWGTDSMWLHDASGLCSSERSFCERLFFLIDLFGEPESHLYQRTGYFALDKVGEMTVMENKYIHTHTPWVEYHILFSFSIYHETTLVASWHLHAPHTHTLSIASLLLRLCDRVEALVWYQTLQQCIVGL